MLASHDPTPAPGEVFFLLDLLRTGIIVLGVVGLARAVRLLWLGVNPPPGWRARMFYCVLSLPPLVGTQFYQFGHPPVWWRLGLTVAALVALWWGIRSLDPRWIGATPTERNAVNARIAALDDALAALQRDREAREQRGQT